MRLFSTFMLGLAALFSVGCSEPSQAQAVERFVVKGRVVDENGKPLSGVKVVADNEWLYASYVIGHTGPDGRYRIQLPRANASFHVSAMATRKVGTQTIQMHLEPDNSASFASNDGAIRNFSLKVTGKRPDGGNYGGKVVVYRPIESPIDPTEVVLNLQPVNGGQAITGQAKRTPDGPALKDVPVNLYRVTASLNGRPLKIRLRDEGEFGSSVTAEFKEFLTGQYKLDVEVE